MLASILVATRAACLLIPKSTTHQCTGVAHAFGVVNMGMGEGSKGGVKGGERGGGGGGGG